MKKCDRDSAGSDGTFPDGGDNRQDDSCSQCGWNQYGTAIDGGRGKACQNMIMLYVVQDGQRLPFVLKAPASSLGKRESLIPWLTNAVNEGCAGKYQTIRVRFSLYRKEFDRYPASILKLEAVRVLEPVIKCYHRVHILEANGPSCRLRESKRRLQRKGSKASEREPCDLEEPEPEEASKK